MLALPSHLPQDWRSRTFVLWGVVLQNGWRFCMRRRRSAMIITRCVSENIKKNSHLQSMWHFFKMLPDKTCSSAESGAVASQSATVEKHLLKKSHEYRTKCFYNCGHLVALWWAEGNVNMRHFSDSSWCARRPVTFACNAPTDVVSASTSIFRRLWQ